MGDDSGLGIVGWVLLATAGIGSCNACNDSSTAVKNTELLTKHVVVLEQKVDSMSKLYVQNVTGSSVADEFYIINGDTAYVKIDGKKVTNSRYKINQE